MKRHKLRDLLVVHRSIRPLSRPPEALTSRRCLRVRVLCFEVHVFVLYVCVYCKVFALARLMSDRCLCGFRDSKTIHRSLHPFMLDTVLRSTYVDVYVHLNSDRRVRGDAVSTMLKCARYFATETVHRSSCRMKLLL